ncbi:uncharacterized protein BXZ73DRAFT_98162 [Epithele typhae]|uniref:uncharacterized protein n=1 Tax=Epithele typhae TaxID=378194 RepID=UPI0020082351|nr:uncharacterized protein BXZ73DRAFT_98162 [Epithele typhae]KAH9941772.1 hypothetical protein BXZ73DRAFT_98162 [Epithele typhae]
MRDHFGAYTDSLLEWFLGGLFRSKRQLCVDIPGKKHEEVQASRRRASATQLNDAECLGDLVREVAQGVEEVCTLLMQQAVFFHVLFDQAKCELAKEIQGRIATLEVKDGAFQAEEYRCYSAQERVEEPPPYWRELIALYAVYAKAKKIF